MRAIFLILVIQQVLFSCKSDDTNITITAGGGGGDVPQGITCQNAIYGLWEESLYVLPYPVGITYRVDLNQCSSSYHGSGSPDQFAVDFAMPIGAIITASRAGVVVFIRESGVDFNHPNNLVIIEHLDGTFAQYMHLTQNGALVEIGDQVGQGSTLGLSGATGLAGYPHLHFVITQGSDFSYPYTSIPHNFKNTDPNPNGPTMNTNYEALPY